MKAAKLIESSSPAIIEVGAGKGYLALDILDSLKQQQNFYHSLQYYIIENSPASIKRSKEILKNHLPIIEWVPSLSSIPAQEIEGIIISNELIDALPFHRVKLIDGELLEVFVSLEYDNFIEIYRKPSTEKLADYLQPNGIELENDQECEINIEAANWISQAARILRKGVVITIDYGFLSTELFSPLRTKGTYKCMYQHTINELPYINIGQQDITAHVDFTNLIRAGDLIGLNKVKYTTQGQFLLDWEIVDIMGEQQDEKSRTAMKTLFLPNAMGNSFKILLQEKGLVNSLLNNYPEPPFKISFHIL